MAIIGRYTREQIETHFSHVGWLCGMCPVYIRSAESDCPELDARNWVPEWWLDFTVLLFGMFCSGMQLLDPSFEPAFPITVTGEIAKEGHDGAR